MEIKLNCISVENCQYRTGGPAIANTDMTAPLTLFR